MRQFGRPGTDRWRRARRVGLTWVLTALVAAGCGGGGDAAGTGGAEVYPDERRSAGQAGARGDEVGVPSPGGAADGASGAAEPLAVGITEPNPAFVWAPGAHAVPAPFARWRRALAQVRPRFYRLVLDWAALQPAAGSPADLSAPVSGCMRAVGPCAGWEGVREQLAALASRQREGGWEGVAVITGTPTWAARPREGCERVGTQPRSRVPGAQALGAYERLVRDVLGAARAAGAEVRWWSAWNEPNDYRLLSPQRARCRTSSRVLSPARYATLARALGRALDAAPGPQEPVLGDLAGAVEPKLGATPVDRFLAALPRDVVCGAAVYAQHAYVGSPDPVPAARRALRARRCGRPHAVWITQTGAPVAAGAGPAERRTACRALHDTLVRWDAMPGVTAAFQYTLREDDRFPMGLVATRLGRAFPALREWRAWGSSEAGEPVRAAACG